MDTRHSLTKSALPVNLRLEFLTPEQIIRIDKVLAAVGEYGEVHLIIQRGELRYINRVESYKAWNDKQK
jgi:hypothetical protein